MGSNSAFKGLNSTEGILMFVFWTTPYTIIFRIPLWFRICILVS